MGTPDTIHEDKPSKKVASVICAPQLADALLRLEARLNDMEAGSQWTLDQLMAAQDDIRQPLWRMNDVMCGKRPGVDFDGPASETVPEGETIDEKVASDIASVLDKGYVRLGRLASGAAQPEEEERRKLLRDVRYAANDLRRALEDIRPEGTKASI
jgi:hypothetical protein